MSAATKEYFIFPGDMALIENQQQKSPAVSLGTKFKHPTRTKNITYLHPAGHRVIIAAINILCHTALLNIYDTGSIFTIGKTYFALQFCI